MRGPPYLRVDPRQTDSRRENRSEYLVSIWYRGANDRMDGSLGPDYHIEALAASTFNRILHMSACLHKAARPIWEDTHTKELRRCELHQKVIHEVIDLGIPVNETR